MNTRTIRSEAVANWELSKPVHNSNHHWTQPSRCKRVITTPSERVAGRLVSLVAAVAVAAVLAPVVSAIVVALGQLVRV